MFIILISSVFNRLEQCQFQTPSPYGINRFEVTLLSQCEVSHSGAGLC